MMDLEFDLSILDDKERKDAIDYIINLILGSKIGLPYKRNFTTNDQIIQKFVNLKNSDMKIKPIKQCYEISSFRSQRIKNLFVYLDKYIIEVPSSYYQDIDILTDYFSEPQRLKGEFSGQRSIHDLWRDKLFLNKLITETYKEGKLITLENLRETIYRIAKETNQFKASVSKTILNFFKAKNVLDFSSGWGDRLIGFLASNAEIYHGFDPNTSLTEAYTEIIKLFCPSEKTAVIYPFPFESRDSKPNKDFYDICFTSPPFYKLEIYSRDCNQSSERYPEFSDWMVNFLFASLLKVKASLIPGGRLVIYITDYSNLSIVEPMMLFLEFIGIYYVSTIYMSKENTTKKYDFKPIRVFVKSGCPREESMAEMAKYFPSIYQRTMILMDVMKPLS